MGNVLEKSKREQVISLGRLGWSLRRIEEATGVRRETAGGYLRLAGIALRRPGGWGHGSPAKPAIEVTTGSLDLGSEDYNSEVRKKSWFDSGTYPTATFISTSLKPGAAGHFDATGVLTLKGKTQTVAVPVVVSKVGTALAFDGALKISRKYFAVGSAEWNDVLEDIVSVRFHILE